MNKSQELMNEIEVSEAKPDDSKSMDVLIKLMKDSEEEAMSGDVDAKTIISRVMAGLKEIKKGLKK